MKPTAAIAVNGPEGPSLQITVDPPLTETCNQILVPLAALPDRRLSHGITDHETETGCTCGVCDLCTAALEILLAEHYGRLNPDHLDRLDADLAARLVRFGGIPGKVWNDQGQAIEDAAALELAAIVVRATGALVRTG